MAKFAPQDEKPFNPITDKLLQAVSGAPPATTATADEELQPVRRPREASSKVVPLPTPATEYAEYENAERLTRQMRYQATPTEELETKELLRRLSLAPQEFLRFQRSEEHTSELQSPCNLVCRLLLEKKKKQ